ncbi:MAG: methionyl-tRNA formyltransferase [Coriobacteriia bacterium]|nr:methionyl-tRNA formyltransferase [Coriobacteriia bacterium]
MNIVFMGTPDFAVPALAALASCPEHHLSAIFTRPDAVSKRGSALVPSPVRAKAEELGLGACVHTPRSFYVCDEPGATSPSANKVRTVDPELLAVLNDTNCDVIVVAAYGVILPAEVLELPAYGCINIHASLLPRWRGAAPIQRALLAGDAQCGVSIMQMEEGLDTGPYCATAKTPTENKNAVELTAELAALGAELLALSLPAIAGDTASWTEQDNEKATYAPKIDKQEMLLVPEDTMLANLRRVRASSPQTPARCTLAGRSVTVLAANLPERTEKEPHAKQLYFACADGSLEILELKPDGKRAMSAQAFLAGL